MNEDLILLDESMQDLEWFQKNSNELAVEYEGQIVAIKNKRIMANAKNSQMLLEILERNNVDPSTVIIERIPHKGEIIIL
ncbi:MAG: DUF5678 domain-containing protein [Nanoarchaeota archaeon]|nr:DUF5678 domain-containing protein [Nanoarchaeota archaeon]